MENKIAENNFAYIDGANLHKGIKSLGWELDFKKFRIWLEEKYFVKTAYLFIGLVLKNKNLYTYLQESGYVLVYKEITYDGSGKVKGNCDADLVLKATVDYYEKRFNKAVLVASDGDYAGLVKFLSDRKSLMAILSPALPPKCSILLKRTGAKIAYLDDQRSMLKRLK
ncbi:MAG: Uncharacterized protein CEN90_602 [Parcubacteria group bacterium Licking1014_17]|nr:MAG: Uncharacterized protein CEN90_602 [Parcubacteria group bacterium Licking1014_17]